MNIILFHNYIGNGRGERLNEQYWEELIKRINVNIIISNKLNELYKVK